MADINTLATVCEALKAGLATATGFSATTVTDDDFRIVNNASSIFVFPAGTGAQELLFSGSAANMFQVRYEVTVELWEKMTGSLARLYNDAQTHIDAILAWLRANDSLSDTSGVFVTCHAGQVRWDAKDVRNEQSGIDYRLVTFTVPCLLTGLT